MNGRCPLAILRCKMNGVLWLSFVVALGPPPTLSHVLANSRVVLSGNLVYEVVCVMLSIQWASPNPATVRFGSSVSDFFVNANIERCESISL